MLARGLIFIVGLVAVLGVLWLRKEQCDRA
jgi:hypothetical protein